MPKMPFPSYLPSPKINRLRGQSALKRKKITILRDMLHFMEKLYFLFLFNSEQLCFKKYPVFLQILFLITL